MSAVIEAAGAAVSDNSAAPATHTDSRWALKKERDERYQSATDLMRDQNRWADVGC